MIRWGFGNIQLSRLAFRKDEPFELCLLFMVSCILHSWAVGFPFSHLLPHAFFCLLLQLGAKCDIIRLHADLRGYSLLWAMLATLFFGSSVVFWCWGCWCNLYSSLGIWISKAGVKITTGLWTSCHICITKGRGFISFEILPRKEKVTNSSRGAFSMQERDQWLRSLDRLVKEQWDAMEWIGVYSQTEPDSNSILSYSPTRWGG